MFFQVDGGAHPALATALDDLCTYGARICIHMRISRWLFTCADFHMHMCSGCKIIALPCSQVRRPFLLDFDLPGDAQIDATVREKMSGEDYGGGGREVGLLGTILNMRGV